MSITIVGMAGAVKALDSHQLDPSIGVDSVNQRPRFGEMVPWRQPLAVASVPAGRKTIYRFGRDVASDANYWFSWTTVVHAVRGFLASDTTERTYFSGSGTPKVTDNIIGLAGAPYPTSARELGVPAPSGTSAITQVTAGTGTARLTFYADTFITDKGEESKPRLIGSITTAPGAIVDITSLPPVPAGNYGVTTRRLYRSEVGTSGQGEFFFLRDVPSGDASVQDDARALGAGTMVTTGWEMPPADMHSLVGLWGGMMAGISGRSIRFCEPYKPYAWPLSYEIVPPDVTPVGQAVWAKNLLVLTNGRPLLVNGSTPSAMGDEPVEFDQACMSVQSIVASESGVNWASPDGLAYYGTAGSKILTAGILTREQWQAMAPETMVGTLFDGLYLGFYQVGGIWKGFAINATAPAGIYFLETGYPAAYLDKLREAVFVLDGTSVKKWDAGASFMSAKFVSKTFKQAHRVSMCALEVVARVWPVTVQLFADGEARGSRTVTSSEPVTIKGGAPAKEWHAEITSAGVVLGVNIAPSIRDLRNE